MKIVLDKVSKKFNRDWLFKDLDYKFSMANAYAITGPNGSGKTTLLKLISGMIPCTQGTITHYLDGKEIDPEYIYRYISFVAPYMEVPEDLTLREFFRFHFKLKPPRDEFSPEDIAVGSGLQHALAKPIHTFSSGMKQRVKLALGIFSTTPVLLLDEPTTNLDQQGLSWYSDEIAKLKSSKLLIISSNQVQEYKFCNKFIELDKF